MRTGLLSFLLLIPACALPQSIIQGVVKDSKSGEVLPYCSISIKGTTKGAITNSEGVFSISVNLAKDTLVFSYVGYNKSEVASGRFTQKQAVGLERKDILLQELTVYADDDYLYDILDECRKKLLKEQTDRISKVYYGIETQTKEQPIELLECYYNGYLKGATVTRLLLKNGRIGLAELDNRYFLTMNSSKAIGQINLTIKNDQYPAIPFQQRKKELKKLFILELSNSDQEAYHIKFHPRLDFGKNFSGEVWIEKKSLSLIKINLTVEHAAVHPFLPLFPSDSLYNVDLSISQTFKLEENSPAPDHINFFYHVAYKSARDTPTVKTPSIITRDITAKGVLYFFDYGNPFIPPYFEYDTDLDDYRKMSVIPYNEVFWENTNTLILTEQQKLNLGFFRHEGCLINFREGNYGKQFLGIFGLDSTLYETYYSFWSADKRISLNKKLNQNKTYNQQKINSSILTNLYHLKVQILLDVTQSDNTFYYKSYTVFDANKTFYHLPEEPYTNAFLNIYFDICEIERRKMENALNKHPYTISQIDSIYKDASKSIDRVTKQYLKEVQSGKNAKWMTRWNNYILQQLDIDNMAIFQERSNNR